MNCNELERYLHEFLDNELAPDKRSEVANHLASCRRCAVKVAEFELANRRLRSLKAVEPPADFLQQVRARIQEAATEPAPPAESVWQTVARVFLTPSWMRVPLAAVAAFALVLLVLAVTQSRHVSIPASYQLTRNDLQRAKEGEAVAGKPNGTTGEEKSREAREPATAPSVESPPPAVALGTPGEAPRLSLALAGTNGDSRAAEGSMTAAPVVVDGASEAVAAVKGIPLGGAPAPAGEAKAGEEVSPAAGKKEPALADKEEQTNWAVATAAAPSPPAAPGSVFAERKMPPPASKKVRRTAEPLAKAEIPPVTNRPPGLQSGWLDLATLNFYLEFGRASTGSFVRGHLDEKNRFQVTSTEVEGQVIELDAKQAAQRGAYGWLELSVREFVPARPGLKPSYPYLEGYQDKQGEFHPISRRIYRAEK